MLKQSLLVLFAASLISVAAPFAAAQDSPSNDRQSNDQQSQPSQQEGHRHHGPDPAQRTEELTRHLKLTSDQQTKVKDALQSEHSQMESLHQDSSLSQDDRRAKMMDIRKGTDAQIRELLDPTQQKKWDEMQAKRGEWMQHRHQGPDSGSDPQSKPPQQ
jgi:Spy/CpxP family protein refolding chaperone